MVYRQVEPTLTWRMEVHEQRTALLLQEVVQEVSPQGWSLYRVTSDGSAFTSEPPGTSDPQHLLWCGSCGGTGRWSPRLKSE